MVVGGDCEIGRVIAASGSIGGIARDRIRFLDLALSLLLAGEP
jgi:hypothetical protein